MIILQNTMIVGVEVKHEVKAHGSSNAKEIKNAVEQCIQFVDADINVKIKDTLTDVK